MRVYGVVISRKLESERLFFVSMLGFFRENIRGRRG
jgi:hypothetical protein